MAALKLGVVGPGLIWDNVHRDVLLSMPEQFRIVAFHARRESTLDKAHGQVADAALHTSYEELLASPAVEAVVLLTPIPQNAPMTIRALEAGKPVFVEKPFAASNDEGRAVIAAAQRSGLPVYVLEQAPYAGIWDRVSQHIRAGRIGRPATYEKVRHVFLDPKEDQSAGYGTTDWRIHTTFPLGNLFDGGVHDLAVHHKLFGPPTTLRAWGNSFRDSFGDFDQVSTVLRYPDGLTGYFSHSAFLGGRRNYFTIRGTEGLIHEEHGSATLESKRGTEEVIPRDSQTPHMQMWQALAQAVRTGSEPPYRVEDAARDVALMEQIAESLATGTEVKAQ